MVLMSDMLVKQLNKALIERMMRAELTKTD